MRERGTVVNDREELANIFKGLRVEDNRRGDMEIVAFVINRTFVRDRPGRNVVFSQAVKWGVRYVLQNYSRSFTIDELADFVGLSKYHFTRKFHKETGLTPGVFLRRYRILQAMGKLICSDEAIHKIASSVGYRGHAAFSRAFNRVMGMQPITCRTAPRNGNMQTPGPPDKVAAEQETCVEVGRDHGEEGTGL